MEKKHCQICERDIKANTGVIAHHGYKRPHGEGWQTASCWGARHLPYEESCDQIQPCIEYITAYVTSQEARLKEFFKNPPATLSRFYPYSAPRVYEKPADFDAEANAAKGSWSGKDEMYGYEHNSQAGMIRMSIREGNRDIKRLTARLAAWKVL